MNLTTKLMGLALALVIAASPAIAQQGEGTGGDFNLDTSRNAAAVDADDKTLVVGDGFNIEFSSTTLTGGVAAFGDIAPVSFDILENAGLGLGLGTGINRFVVFDGISDPLGPAMVGGVASLSFVVPPSTDWDNGGSFAANLGFPIADDWGFFLQGATLDPTGPFGVQISNTVKHEVVSMNNDGFSDTCADALTMNGLTDSDLGVSQFVDTTTYNNDLAADYGILGTTTAVNVAAAGTAGFNASNNRDAFITFTSTSGGSYNFSLCGSDYDTAMVIIADDCTTALISNDDNNPVCGAGFRSFIPNFCMTAGQTVIIMVDGWSGAGTSTSEGVANLIVTQNTGFSVDGQDISTGEQAGGETVVFSGCNLNLVTSVTFGGNAGSILSTTGQTLTVEVPASTMGEGAVDIVLDDGVAPVTLTGGWTYLPNFTVTGQDINSGDLPGGEVVTFTGTGLTNVTGVTVGGVAATFVAIDANTLEVTVPAGAAGTVDVEITDGTDTVTITGGWSYADLSLPSFSECSMPALVITGAPVAPVTVTDTITVAEAANATIAAGSLTVDVDISHTWVADMIIDLTAPDGVTTFNLWNEDGGSNDNIVGTYPGGVNPNGGDVLTPSGNGDFSELDGTSPNGTWTLDITDVFDGTDGVLNMWCVNGEIDYAVIPVSDVSMPGTVIPTTGPPNMISDTITITDTTPITVMTVDVDISHTWVGDLEVDVTSPALTTVRLIDNSNGNTDNLIGTYPGGTNMGATPFALDPLGNGDFSEFFGELTAGDWVLDINDTANGDGGALNSWGVNFN
jgi:subtilisin-like proprotein convertase family protein